jgi:serine/threonine-protein kinase HipA
MCMLTSISGADRGINLLSYERVRGNDHFAFEFSREWLSRHGGTILSGDVMNVRGMQYPRQDNSVLGLVNDSFSDRWSRAFWTAGNDWQRRKRRKL